MIVRSMSALMFHLLQVIVMEIMKHPSSVLELMVNLSILINAVVLINALKNYDTVLQSK